MEYLLKDIPGDLWDRVEEAAAERGKSVDAFLIDAAFNEVARTHTVLRTGRKAAAQALARARDGVFKSKESLYLRNLRTVGIATFIKYFELLQESSNSEAVDALQAWEDYTYNSASTKVSTGKRIIGDPEALRFCLSHVAFRAERISPDLKERAGDLLKKVSDRLKRRE